MLSLLTALLLTQTAPTPMVKPVDATNRCTKNSDCVITTLQCCQGCCGPSPYATTKAADEKKRQQCAVIDCERPKCDIVCEPPASADAFKAVCVAHECRMVAR